MRTFITRGLLLAGCVLSPAITQAESAAPVDQSKWPQKVTITVDDIRTRIDGPKNWTMSGLDFKGKVMATEDSAYGCVFTIRNVGHLGTAHFLDVPGKPGQVEKEDVSSLQLFIDDKPVKNFKPAMDLRGKSFQMERKSTIRTTEVNSSILVRDGVVIETTRLRATAPVDLQKGHPLMYAWTPKATAYLLGDDSGIQTRGTFVAPGAATDVKTIKTSKWMAVFDPTTNQGSVCYLSKQPPDEEVWFLLIDAPAAYRKQALYTHVDKIMPAGFDGTYQCIIGFFNATEKEWESAATKRVDELKAYNAKLAAQ